MVQSQVEGGMTTENNGSNTDPLLAWRDEFPILKETTYMVSNSLGAMPRGVYDSLHAYADMWAARGVRAWREGWFDLNVQTGDKIGKVIGAQPGTITMHQNISIAHAILLSALKLDGPRSKVVIEGGIFPSEYYLFRQMLPPHMELHKVPLNRDGISVSVDRIIEAIDERTLLVSVSHVLFRSAYVVDVRPIIQRAHKVGAMVLLSGFHASGIVPTDLTDLNVDFYMSGVLKWMCGGPGGCFLYVRPDLIHRLRPKLTGWFADKHPFDFKVTAIDYRDDIYRFLNGTHAVPNLYAVQPGVDIIAEVGVDNIRAKSLRQTHLLIQLAEAAGYQVNSPRATSERGGTITINPPHAYEVSQELLARNIIIDYRPQAGIRVSPHFYNTDEECRMVVETMQDILKQGAWEQHAAQHEFIT